MRVILKESVENLGVLGDVVEVRDGYARNFLLPKALAEPATPQALALLEQRRKKIERERRSVLEEAQKLAQRLSGQAINIEVRVGEEGQMYGSVGAGEIVSRIAEELGVEIEKRQVLLPEPIRELGVHEVGIRLHPEVTVQVKFLVMKAAN
ncbi:MAG: 50S ribosomal protein L9 [Candidatus Hydrogenedentota bacterium]|nr:MAG: 50S ribosomal protein L9 [Candidatus Hydrogenedentota bacterium]